MTSIAREIAKRIGKLMEEETKEFIEELEKEKEIAEEDKKIGEFAATKEKEILER